MPSSRAIWAIDLPLVSANRTASRLNSCVYVFYTFAMILLLPLK